MDEIFALRGKEKKRWLEKWLPPCHEDGDESENYEEWILGFLAAREAGKPKRARVDGGEEKDFPHE